MSTKRCLIDLGLAAWIQEGRTWLWLGITLQSLLSPVCPSEIFPGAEPPLRLGSAQCPHCSGGVRGGTQPWGAERVENQTSRQRCVSPGNSHILPSFATSFEHAPSSGIVEIPVGQVAALAGNPGVEGACAVPRAAAHLGGSEMHLVLGHRNLRAKQLFPLSRLYQLQPHQQN